MAPATPVDPAAQAPVERAAPSQNRRAALLRLRRPLSAHVQQLHARYLAGELSWLQVYMALDAAPGG